MTWDDVHPLLPRLKAQDPAAWSDLAALALPFLRVVAAEAVGPGWADVSGSDVVQEAWLKVRGGFDNFRGAGTPADTAACLRAWARKVVRTTAAGLARRNPHPTGPTPDLPVAAAGDPSPSSQAARAEWRSRLDAAMATLGPDERRIVQRTLLEGASCRQVAAELGLPDHTAVGEWRKEILARLRRALGDAE